jgi:hypothetical protein
MEPQTFANHTRWHAPFHYFIVPVLVINFIWSVVDFFMKPGWNMGRWAVVSFALIVMATLVRTNPLRAQDRLIRLEENLRFQRVLSADLANQAAHLPPNQLVALRFAPDNELEHLVGEVVAGKLTKQSEIKKAITNWRGDYFRV